jgi:protein-S-isoprenylcysteine O-methyltransferase Ste14
MANQSRIAVVSMARVVFIVALLIFVPAWSLNYWEAWLYLFLLLITTMLMTCFFLKHDPALIERRMHHGPRFETEKSQQIIQSIGGILLSGIFIVSGFEHRMHGSTISPPTVLAANALLLVSTYIVFRTFQENSFAGSTVRVETHQHVISSGPYGWVRHPMYAGCIVGFLVTPLALGSLWGMIPALLKSGTLLARLLYEERYLSLKLQGYQAYRQQVRYRLIPYLW